MAHASLDQITGPPVIDEVHEWLEQSYRERKDYMRRRRWIIRDQGLSAKERQRLLQAEKEQYYGRDCCGGCRSAGEEAPACLPEPGCRHRYA